MNCNDCGRAFTDQLRVSSFLWEVPTLCQDNRVSQLRLCRVKGIRVFRCNPPRALLAKWPGSVTCHCSNTGVERTPNNSKHRKFSLEKPGLELQPFDHEPGALATELSRPRDSIAKYTHFTLKQEEEELRLISSRHIIFHQCGRNVDKRNRLSQNVHVPVVFGSKWH